MAKNNRSKRLIIILSVVVVFLIIISIVGKKQGWIGKGNAIEVELAEVEKREIIEKVNASGKVQPEVELKISPDVSGEIIELNVQEGDSVKKGDLLIRIRQDIYLNQLDQAKANANNARANLSQMKANLARAKARFQQSEFNFKRNKKLHEDNVISDLDYEQSETDYKVAEQELEGQKQNVRAAEFSLQNALAAVRVAEDNLSFTKIFAPESGIISKLSIEQGERVVGTSQMQGTEMLRIANLNNMEVQVDVNENDIIRVSIGDTAEIEVDSYSSENEKFLGIVTAIANSPNESSLTSESITEFEVKIKIVNESYSHLITDNLKYPFKPGMTASVDIITDRQKDIISVPLAAVTTRTSEEIQNKDKADDDEEDSKDEKDDQIDDEEIREIVFLFEEENQKVKLLEVKTGISDFDYIQIKEGLSPGQKIVKGPYLAVTKRLKDGDEVKMMDKESKRSKRAGRAD
ncbi:MAG: efflux RND transporter periplasmic adaptor subunit [Cytophagales bacterium]